MSLTDGTLVAEGRTHDQFAGWLEGELRSMKIRNPSIQELQIELPMPNAATATLTGIATIESSVYAGVVTGTWRFEFSRINGQWKIVSLEPVEGARKFR